jgi:hypothetical protein
MTQYEHRAREDASCALVPRAILLREEGKRGITACVPTQSIAIDRENNRDGFPLIRAATPSR